MPTIMAPTHTSNRTELLQGTLDMLILRTLLFGPAHGHQIAKHIQRTTVDVLQVEHGSARAVGNPSFIYRMPAEHQRESGLARCGLSHSLLSTTPSDVASSESEERNAVSGAQLLIRHDELLAKLAQCMLIQGTSEAG